MKIIINASNMHAGGGKTMLVDFLNTAKSIESINFVFLVDQRFDEKDYSAKNIIIKKYTPYQRIFIFKYIKKISNDGDLIIYFGNIPPLKKHNQKTLLFQSNRMMVEKYPLKGYPLKWKIRVPFEKILVRICLNNVDEIVVQTFSMKYIIQNFRINKFRGKVSILPFKNLEGQVDKVSEKESDSFLYVAGPDPHKNHRNLLIAWKLLHDEGIRPKLYLTVDDDVFVNQYNFIKDYIKQNQLSIEIKPRLSRSELLEYFNNVSALIYPSFFEAYGLPLIEAQHHHLPIIASELDYVRDLIDPVEVFNPYSPLSISRSVKRFLNIKENRQHIMTSEELFKQILRKKK